MAKRRANGEGNIRKRKDGRWEGRYTAGYDLDIGKRIIKNVLDKTQAEVKEKLQAAILAAQTLYIDITRADGYTVEQWVNTWFETSSKSVYVPLTQDRRDVPSGFGSQSPQENPEGCRAGAYPIQ